MVSQPPQASARRGGWGALVGALLILAVVGVVTAWLRYTGELGPLLSATPRVEIDLPPPDESPLETVAAEEAPARTTAPGIATPAAEAARTQAPLPTADPQEPIVIPAAPAPPATDPSPVEATAPQPASEPAPEPAHTQPQAAPVAMSSALPAWRRFARPFEADDPRPRIAVIVAELGLRETATQAAIERLPASVTLSFSPYARGLQKWIDAARADGHEVMLDLPMEPVSFPRDDPGPKALFTSLSEAENQARLADILDRAEGYVGVVPWMGSRFTTSADDLRPVLQALGKRGLMFVDARAAPESLAARIAREANVPRAINDRFLDHEASRVAIDSRFQQIEQQARATGFAVAMASPYPITIERLDQWVRTLKRKDLVLAPISALADKQEER